MCRFAERSPVSTSSRPEGPGSVSAAPNLSQGFADTFASRYVDAGDVRRHAVVGGEGPPLLLIYGWPGRGTTGDSSRRADAVWYYVDRLAPSPELMHGSFQLYRAFGVTAAQKEERKKRTLPMPALAMGGAESSGAMVEETMRLVADDVEGHVFPGTGHWLAEQGPDDMMALRTDFLAPYRDRAATAQHAGAAH